ncbi:MAG: glycosyltransferase family 4 protein [Alphaproteobacteria bacterium]|nr:glycosyltransferase family 4 protein [Alphaproteobacteria bacterium]
MRVLYSHRVQSRDGQSVHIEGLVNALRHVGVEVFMAGPSVYERAKFGGEGAPVAAIRRILPGAVIELAEIYYNILAYLRLRRAYKTFNPDVIYERYNLYFLAGTLLAWWNRIPFYLEVNSSLAEERARYGSLKLRRLAKVLEGLVWRSADRVFVVTEVLKGIVAAAGVDSERIIVVPNGVDRESFPATPYQARPGAPITIGFIGFVRDWHGLDGVIAGLAQPLDPPIRLIVAGDGPARPALERQAQQLGVEGRVQFIGVQPRRSIPDLIHSFDIALQPRAVGYASPLKLFEYMAAGRAIVAPDQPNIREILTHDETAMLFDPEEPAALWGAIRRLAADAQSRERLGFAARRALDARDYTWEANAVRITEAIAADSPRSMAATGAVPALDRPAGRGAR